MELTEKKYLNEEGLIKLLSLIKSVFYTSKEIDEFFRNFNGEGGGGLPYDDTALKEWIKTNFLQKGDINLDDYEKTSDLLIKLASLATKEEIKDMATQTYVDEETKKLIEELNKKCNVVVCDNQYEFDQILTKDNNTIYLIKGDQDQWFSKEDGDELYDFYGELRERVSHLERLNGITDYNNEEENNNE